MNNKNRTNQIRQLYNYLLNLGRGRGTMFRLIAINLSQKSPHFSLYMLSSTSSCELSEREVTAPSNLKVVIALGCHELSVNYVSPYIVLVWFFLPLLLSEACPDHNFFVFRDRSMIFGMWVHEHKAVCHIP